MEIRKAVTGAVLGTGMAAMVVVGAGTAFASGGNEGPSYGHKDKDKASTSVSVSKSFNKKQNISGNQIGSGNQNATATDSGNITSNNTNSGVSVPISTQLNPKVNLGLKLNASGANSGAASTSGNASKGGKNEAKTDADSTVAQKDKTVQKDEQDVTSTGAKQTVSNSTSVNNSYGGNLSPVVIVQAQH